MMIVSMVPAMAAPTANAHTITISNTDQNVPHSYKVYQIFSGNLNADENTLSDIAWGSGVNGTNLLAALVAANETDLVFTAAGTDALGKTVAAGDSFFKNCENAQDVAKVLATLTSTATFTVATKTLDGTNEAAGALDVVAKIIGGDPADSTNYPGFLTNEAAANEDGSATATFTPNSAGTSYSANVWGDGYYFIKDTTTTLTNDTDPTKGSDTLAKYMLTVIRDETIVAKDTGITPNKKILDAVNGTPTESRVADDSSAIGDTVTFEVTVAVPNTLKYQDHFWFVMKDVLPAGITFTGIQSVTIGNKTLADVNKQSTTPDLTDGNYTGAAGYYTLKLSSDGTTYSAPTKDTNDTSKYTFEVDTFDAVEAAGGQYLELTFNQFKKFVEANSLIGETVTVTYTGVVNDDAQYQGTGNENEVYFNYSNNPNHDYDGDNPGPDDDSVTGETPHRKTRTYTTSLKVLKVDQDNQPLEGATFKLTGTSLNRTVITGYKFVATSYTPVNGEDVDSSKNYWKLKEGSYTTTDPTTVANTTQYEDVNTKYYKVTYQFDEVRVADKSLDIELVTEIVGTGANAKAYAEFVGLREGTDYTLEETAAPDGYNKLDGKATFKIEWTDPTATTKPAGMSDTDWDTAKASGGFYLTVTSDTTDPDAYTITWNTTDKQFEVTIQNNSGAVLPSTGGIGTTIFYIAGSILVLAAAILLITKRRMGAND